MDQNPIKDSTRTHFVESGSIPKPGPIGRLVRLFLGYFCLYFFWQLVTKGGILIQVGIPNQTALWIGVALAFLVFPYVVNIGFRRDWGRWPQAAIVLMAMAASGASFFIYGSVWGPPLAWLAGKNRRETSSPDMEPGRGGSKCSWMRRAISTSFSRRAFSRESAWRRAFSSAMASC